MEVFDVDEGSVLENTPAAQKMYDTSQDIHAFMVKTSKKIIGKMMKGLEKLHSTYLDLTFKDCAKNVNCDLPISEWY